MTTEAPRNDIPHDVLLKYLTKARMGTYLEECCGDLEMALRLYEWNTQVTGAVWELLTHVEVVLRNALARALYQRHQRLSRNGSWLDDPQNELDDHAHKDIAEARHRVQQGGHSASDGQTISELGFGFWRYLLARRYTSTLWPSMASAFPGAPTRARAPIEDLVEPLHRLRNRIAHHQRIWHEPLTERYTGMITVLGYIDPAVAAWAAAGLRLPALLDQRPHTV